MLPRTQRDAHPPSAALAAPFPTAGPEPRHYAVAEDKPATFLFRIAPEEVSVRVERFGKRVHALEPTTAWAWRGDTPTQRIIAGEGPTSNSPPGPQDPRLSALFALQTVSLWPQINPSRTRRGRFPRRQVAVRMARRRGPGSSESLGGAPYPSPDWRSLSVMRFSDFIHSMKRGGKPSRSLSNCLS